MYIVILIGKKLKGILDIFIFLCNTQEKIVFLTIRILIIIIYVMDILKEKGHLIIENVIDFDIAQTLECGQCFNFKKIDEMEYGVVAYDKLLHIYQEGDTLYLYNIEKMEDAKFWCEYFDLYRDYGKIKK